VKRGKGWGVGGNDCGKGTGFVPRYQWKRRLNSKEHCQMVSFGKKEGGNPNQKTRRVIKLPKKKARERYLLHNIVAAKSLKKKSKSVLLVPVRQVLRENRRGLAGEKGSAERDWY